MEKRELRLDRLREIGTDTGLRVLWREGGSYPLHAHNYFELEIVLGGRGVQWVDCKEYPLCRGSVYLLSPANFHEVSADEDLQLWNISFIETVLPQERLEVLLSGAYQPVQQLDEEKLEKLDMTVQLLQRESDSGGYVHPLMEYLLAQVMRHENPVKTTPIQKAVAYLETHFRDDPSLAQTAEQACLSPVYFGSLFKQYTGQTYVNYLNSRKVHCAKMLLESGWSVTEACYNAGFGSLSGFLHTFRKTVGITPREYSRIHSGK